MLRVVPTTEETRIDSRQLEVILQRRLALPLTGAPPSDPYGDSLQNKCNHVCRHDLPKLRWYRAFEATWGASNTDLDPHDGSYELYSPGYRPDLVALYQGHDHHHMVADCKVVSPFTTSTTQQDRARAAAVGMANTEEQMHEKVLGRAAFRRGRSGNFDRRTNTGSRVAVRADYTRAIALGTAVVPIVHEVFGGWGLRACRLFRRMARVHADRLDAGLATWATRSFSAYHSQRISVAIHTTAAKEILAGMSAPTAKRGKAQRGREHVQPGTRARDPQPHAQPGPAAGGRAA